MYNYKTTHNMSHSRSLKQCSSNQNPPTSPNYFKQYVLLWIVMYQDQQCTFKPNIFIHMFSMCVSPVSITSILKVFHFIRNFFHCWFNVHSRFIKCMEMVFDTFCPLENCIKRRHTGSGLKNMATQSSTLKNFQGKSICQFCLFT